MTELRQARFFAASCVAFYVIMVWAFWKEPGAPPRMLEAPEAAQVADDTRYGEAVWAVLSLADLVCWAIEPPARVTRHLAAVCRAWMGLPAAMEPGC